MQMMIRLIVYVALMKTVTMMTIRTSLSLWALKEIPLIKSSWFSWIDTQETLSKHHQE